MKRFSPALPAILAGAFLAAGASALSPALADTTVAQYDALPRAKQAHLLGTLLQSLADDLQKHNRNQEAQCLAELYTNSETDARQVQSRGMTDFLETVAVAREKGPETFTIEDIITRQMVLACGTQPKSKKP